ncbi:MAG TPA: Rieske (2Fe-2S) protein [Candidatus Nanopelagicales bacterium]|nr:Rieske (2Fe-2S) protein [Candidatus Nanopelagicales bacterium]
MTTPAPEPVAAAAGPSRRQVLVTGGAVVAAAAVTAACGSGRNDGGAAGPASSAAGTTVKTSDVPVGGGTILRDVQVVVTQPSAGTYKAFSAVCTHEGCLVAQVAQGAIDCPCHGAQFSITDGSVIGGPAPAPLAAVPMAVSGDTITLS